MWLLRVIGAFSVPAVTLACPATSGSSDVHEAGLAAVDVRRERAQHSHADMQLSLRGRAAASSAPHTTFACPGGPR